MEGIILTQPYYEKREITDFKDLINQSTSIYGNKNAFLVKGIMGDYTGITYKEFKSDIDAVGTEFINMGLKHEKIAVIGENRYEWCLTYLATTNGTGTIVPLDKDLPQNEIKNLLERSRAKAIIFSDKIKSNILAIKDELPELKYCINMDLAQDEDEILSFQKMFKKGKDLMKIGDTKFINAKVNPKEATILIFTSGTTGLAKGVMLSQENVCTDIRVVTSVIDVKDSDVALSILPLHHTYECTTGFLLMLYSGVTISFCEGLKHIVQNMQEVKPTVMLGVPLLYENMYKKIWDTAEKNKEDNKLKNAIKLSNFLLRFNIDLRKKLFKKILNNFGGRMRLSIAGGAASKPEVLKGLQEIGFFVIQGYGLTEASPIAMVNHVQRYKNNSIGLPVPEIEAKIDNPNEDGIGELLIKGNIIMQGYYENDEATRASFTKDGWLKTGDLGYKDKEGFYYITGREKNVIVTKNGKNIFPEEVETYVNKSAYIKECMVFGKEIEGEIEPKVCVMIVPNKEEISKYLKKEELSSDEIHKFIEAEVKKANKQMPMYKMIREIEIREQEFEKTTTQKIKRKIES